MYPNILKNFISKFVFLTTKLNLSSKIEIKISENETEKNKICGTINIQHISGEKETIIFESIYSKTEDILIFKTKYQYGGKLTEEIDTFSIIKDNQTKYSNPKTKYLFHLANGKIIQAYRVGKNYKFENGIGESLSRFNIENKEVSNMINNIYINNTNKKR